MKTVMPRPDLDGLRLIEPGKPDVWLMFRGERHRVASSDVYDALWSEVEGLVSYEDLDWIRVGPELGEGVCLIRGEGSLFIYLLVRDERGLVQKHFIPTYESLLDFGFDEGKVRSVSPLIIDGVPDGVPIRSAADRAARP